MAGVRIDVGSKSKSSDLSKCIAATGIVQGSGLYHTKESLAATREKKKKELEEKDLDVAAREKLFAIIDKDTQQLNMQVYQEQVYTMLNSTYSKEFGLGKNAVDEQGRTPLHSAIINFNYHAFIWIIEHPTDKTDWDARDEAGLTALDYLFSPAFAMIENEDQQHARKIILCRVLENQSDKQRREHSKRAAQVCDLIYFEAIADLKASNKVPPSQFANESDLIASTFLYRAVEKKHTKAVKYIYDNNIRVAEEGMPELIHKAISEGLVEMYGYLYSIRVRTLHWLHGTQYAVKVDGIIKWADQAVANGKVTAEQALAIQVNHVTSGKNANYVLLESRNPELIKKLTLRHFHSTDLSFYKMPHEDTLLYEHIVKRNLVFALQILIDLRVSLNVDSMIWGKSSPFLDLAASMGSVEVFKLLLNAGAVYHDNTFVVEHEKESNFMPARAHLILSVAHAFDKEVPVDANRPGRARIQSYLDVIRALDNDNIVAANRSVASVNVNDAKDLLDLILKRFKGRYISIIQNIFNTNLEYRKMHPTFEGEENKESLSSSSSSREFSKEREALTFEKVIKETGYRSELFASQGQNDKAYLAAVYSRLDFVKLTLDVINEKDSTKNRQNALIAAVKYLNYPAFIWLTAHPKKDINFNAVDSSGKSAMDYLLDSATSEDKYVQEIRKKMLAVLLVKRSGSQLLKDAHVAAENCDFDYYNELNKLQKEKVISRVHQVVKYRLYDSPSHLGSYDGHMLSTHVDNLVIYLLAAVKKNHLEAVRFIFHHGAEDNYYSYNQALHPHDSRSIKWSAFPAVKHSQLAALAVRKGYYGLFELLKERVDLDGVIQATFDVGNLLTSEQINAIRAHCFKFIFSLPAEDVGYLFVHGDDKELRLHLASASLQSSTVNGAPLAVYIAENNLKQKAQLLMRKEYSLIESKSAGLFKKAVSYSPALDRAAAFGSIDVFKIFLQAGAILTDETMQLCSDESEVNEGKARIKAYINVIKLIDASKLDLAVSAAELIQKQDKADLFAFINKRYNNRYLSQFKWALGRESGVTSDDSLSQAAAAASSVTVTSAEINARDNIDVRISGSIEPDNSSSSNVAARDSVGSVEANCMPDYSASDDLTELMLLTNAGSAARLHQPHQVIFASAELSAHFSHDCCSDSEEEREILDKVERKNASGLFGSSSASSSADLQSYVSLIQLASKKHIWRENPGLRRATFKMAAKFLLVELDESDSQLDSLPAPKFQ